MSNTSKSLALAATLTAAFTAGSALAETRTLPMSWTPPSGMTPGPIDGTKASLVTSPEGASMTITTSGITPGHAITVWFVAIQNPEGCAKNPCSPVEAMGKPEMNTVAFNGGGTVVPESGTFTVSSYLPAGDVDGNLFETSLTSPETAEYHLVVHDHGPLIPELAADMISSFRGGCTLDSVPRHYPESAKTDGAGGPNTCKSRQVALFVPKHLMAN